MALKEVAVDGLTLSHSIGSPITGGTFFITSIPSIKVKAEGNGVYSGTLNFTFSGGTYSGGVPGTASGSGSINPTATKTKADGNLVLRVDDNGTMAGSYEQTNPTPPPPTISIPFSGVGVEISNAGQIKVKAE